MTQAELAQRLNYSDKSVSKWEHAESLPDIEVLCQLADLYGVTLDFLTHEGNFEDKRRYVKDDGDKRNKIIITALLVTVIWFIATIIFVYIQLYADKSYWQAFLWAIPASCIALLVMNKRWGNRRYGAILSSALTWSLLLCVYLQFLHLKAFPILVLGVPIQIAIVLISNLKR